MPATTYFELTFTCVASSMPTHNKGYSTKKRHIAIQRVSRSDPPEILQFRGFESNDKR